MIIFNTFGQEIEKRTFNSSLEVDVKKYEKGIYFLRIAEKQTGKEIIRKVAVVAG